MKKLISTDMGYLSPENVRYLVEQNILVKNPKREPTVLEPDYISKFEWHDGASSVNVISWIMEDVKEVTGVSEPDGIITVMRKGFENKYPIVQNVWSYWQIARANSVDKKGYHKKSGRKL